MKKYLIILIAFFCLVTKVYASDVYLNSPRAVARGEIFTLVVQVDTGGEAINSADIAIDFNKDKFEFVGIKEDIGIMKLWVNPPRADHNRLTFSGIIPGGVSGTYNPNRNELAKLTLVGLMFKAKEFGSSEFIFSQADILKNDGLGTKLDSVAHNLSINIVGEKENNISGHESDTNPPLPFDIEYLEPSTRSGTPALLIFSTIDNESGVAKYQIKINGNWHDAVSPYPVTKGIFAKNITIRAVDYTGNVRDSEIYIEGDITLFALFVVFILIICGAYGYKLLKYKYGKKPI